jgi:hypothetical protein
MTSNQWVHDENVRNQYAPSHQYSRDSYSTSRWASSSVADGQKKPYPYHYPITEHQSRHTKRFSSEINGPALVTPTKHSRYFWGEQHSEITAQQGFTHREQQPPWFAAEEQRRLPRNSSCVYQEYNGASFSSTTPPQTPRRLPMECHDRLQTEVYTSSDGMRLQQHNHISGNYGDRYCNYNNFVSPRYSYPPELHRPNFVPISPTASHNIEDRCPASFPGTERSHVKDCNSAYSQGEKSAYQCGFPSASEKGYNHTGPHLERMRLECFNQSRDDVETSLSVSTNCSDDSRDCHEGYYHENMHEVKLVSREHQPLTRRQHSPLVAQSYHPSLRRPASGIDDSLRFVSTDTFDPNHRVRNVPYNASPTNSLSKAVALIEISSSETCSQKNRVNTCSDHEGTSSLLSRVGTFSEINSSGNCNQNVSAINVLMAESQKMIGMVSKPPSPNCSTLVGPKVTGVSINEALVLLALPEDETALSKALCVTRQNVEVFCATEHDVVAPAPGRKNPIVVGQVGLRCIHCRHLSDRVKRAVCYPSSLRRIYRTVTDMKLDHFTACPGVPQEIKDMLDELKISSSRSTSTTMRYFVDSAIKLGLVDTDYGLRFRSDEVPAQIATKTEDSAPSNTSTCSVSKSAADDFSEINDFNDQENCPKMRNLLTTSRELLGGELDLHDAEDLKALPKCSESEAESNEANQSKTPERSSDLIDVVYHTDSPDYVTFSKQECRFFTGCVPLNQKEDRLMLSPLRSFLRENVYAFSATEEDISVRTPTNFSIVLGQVGICCKYCYKLRAKDRSNRAVCFPFSIDRLYQSVADLQRFHFSVCKEIPRDVKEVFESLKSASSKGSKGLATRQYWITSAKKLGLVDSHTGIKFGRDPHSVAAPAVSLDILAQVAVELTARHPLVIPSDRDSIAEFLYYVMSQLQPCRFTEADRNKRRMKEVGCIGVECKHCVGQAESRKFFWSSANAVESNFISVHTHLMDCLFVPTAIKEKISELKGLRKEQSSKLRNGSQKAFFTRVWSRLHEYSGISYSLDT